MLIPSAPVAASELSCDIFPESWISYNGRIQDSSSGGRLLALPTPVKSGKISKVLPVFLAKGNGMRSGCFTFSQSDGGTISIEVIRCNPRTLDLRLALRESDYVRLRKLDWTEFRRLQGEFEKYLYEASAHQCIAALFDKPPRERFGHDFEERLREFWTETLHGTDFAPLAEKLFVRLPQVAQSDKQMGVVALLPGMRLLVHWGATAVYGYSKNKPLVTRATVGGCSILEVGCVDGTMVIGPPSPRSLNSQEPAQGADNSSPVDSPNPLGQQKVTSLLINVRAVANEFDLWQSGGLGQRVPRDTGRYALLTPCEYTKPDLSRPKPDTKNPITSNFHHERLTQADYDTTANADASVGSLTRGFILWRYEKGKAALKNLGQQGDFTQAKMNAWDNPALVFDNQTSVDPEVNFSIDHGGTDWLPVGCTWEYLLRNRVPWVFAADTRGEHAQPLVRIRRAPLSIEDAFLPPDQFTSAELRFWVIPAGQFGQADIFPGDAFYLRP